uniref:CAMK/CAMK1 protein kinase n=1 Tax=Kwoniella dejecticola CBS 10117 TaxID=1296121 RepID=A0A1A5ZZY0_9TREE|nr:CAMK/CAMK1 protein kinase [Kwoniella dejecticola CBS 10117]OBR83375.1 CAMK/CAMK1 protein kinase [Kwoniella dejecticola CBS 10117]
MRMGFDIHHLLPKSSPSKKAAAAAIVEADPHAAIRKKEFNFDSKIIGAGGYSQVLRAHWKARGNIVVAVKVVRKEAVKDREAYLKLIDYGFPRINSHPNICAGLDWFETNSKFYITFPLLTGGELLERLNTRGRFTEDATKMVIKKILEILAYIHSHGIIHRDIKPDNFLYRTPESEVDDVVLIDFGISKSETDEDPKTETEVGGTPGYAAPEVFCGTGYGKNSDLFGVGVIGYNLLSSWSPWESTDTLALVQESATANVNFPPGPFEGVSEQAKGFIRHLMQPPNRRPSAKKALTHLWLSRPIGEVDQEHILQPHEINEGDLEPLQPHHTVKPHHTIAKQLTARPAA